jgi:hypothetical protein
MSPVSHLGCALTGAVLAFGILFYIVLIH